MNNSLRGIHGWSNTRATIDLEASNLVFVYGTLKKEHGNNRLLKGAEFLGETTLAGEYVLRSFGAPTLVHKSEALPTDTLAPVRGEVWVITDEEMLKSLDSLEAHPHGYYRSLCITEFGPAWVYYYPEASYYAADEACPIVNGAYQWK